MRSLLEQGMAWKTRVISCYRSVFGETFDSQLQIALSTLLVPYPSARFESELNNWFESYAFFAETNGLDHVRTEECVNLRFSWLSLYIYSGFRGSMAPLTCHRTSETTVI